jgi:hypothetical protein
MGWDGDDMFGTRHSEMQISVHDFHSRGGDGNEFRILQYEAAEDKSCLHACIACMATMHCIAKLYAAAGGFSGWPDKDNDVVARYCAPGIF